MKRQLKPSDENTLIRQAQRDPARFTMLYRAYAERVYGYVAYRLKNTQEAEDLTATIFIQALRRLSQYDPTRGSFSAWLFGIARHTIQDYWRRDSYQDIALLEHDAALAPEASPEQSTIRSEQAAYVRQMIALLPDRRQEVVVLKFFGGLRNKEIAAVLHLDERTVASHLSRALDDLKKLLVKEEWHDTTS
jgi:RNA polymerase sigma factor (sigma-70 family)